MASVKPLSIIIPTFNEELYLPRLLQSIARASENYDALVQVIVVDGKSTDKTIEVAKDFQNLLPGLEIHSAGRGIAAQRNFGAGKAKYETIILCDGDMEFTKNSLGVINEKLKNRTNFIAMPLIYPYDGRPIDFVLGAMSYAYFYVVQRFSPVISGMCIITTKSVHAKIDGFDERIKYGEDIDYGLRAVKAGARHYLLLGVRVKTSARRLDKDGRMKTGLA